ncbi:MAG: bifunctional UDP-N-acetylmuramoyl-tripeptide:D-alanyl-D-alanine ligase/alanine racemase [Microscillaceae bacterium]|jgi:alanine racemase|nr:bifunctional UDP-N-acetylmuramoyl-tripeptide:D-alanyl-D-alanine ligase/alanine racemase [Microscillaceae bacterium]
MFTIAQILALCGGKAHQLSKPEAPIEHLLIDSRKVAFPETSLFFAIRGERHDGHNYIGELIKKNVRNLIVETDSHPQILAIDKSENPHLNIILVPNTILALQQIVAAHRQQFNYPVIGITGSNGKTIVKEWLYQLLSPDFQIVKSPKSYNSQVGVPLSVWEMQAGHQLAIFEAGISQPNEMANLAEVIRPTLGIFTNIGTAHDEGFESREQKIQEKLQLFRHSEVIYSLHSQTLSRPPYQLTQNFRLITKTQSLDNQSVTIIFEFEQQNYQLDLPFGDEASLENALTCLLILLHFKIPIGEIQSRFLRLKPISMRLELKQGINQCYIIDDSYNNDLAGLDMAMNFMAGQKQKGKRILILSDMLETHLPDNQLYTQIFQLIESKSLIDEVIGIGEKLYAFQDLLIKSEHSFGTQFFASTQDFLQSSLIQNFHNALILIKGARVFQFEQIVKRLQQKTHGTILEINLDAIVHNLNFYRSLLKPATKIMVMVKAFAYGSGSAEVANLLQYHRVDYLGVAYADEGVFLRQNGIHLPIMVMNPNPDTFQQLLDYQLEPEIYSFKMLNEFLNYCREIGKKDFKIHVKMDTGMHRLGFAPDELTDLIAILESQMPWHAQVASLFSHLAGADDARHTEFSQKQIAIFKDCAQKLEEALGYDTLKHILNTSGITRFPQAQFEMVRLGVGLYGVEPNGFYQDKLETVGKLKTTISQIKAIPQGETIGYGRWGVAQQDLQIATIAIGYADGFNRAFSRGVGEVLVNGRRVPVIGNVCMDMTMVDITGIEAQEGDEVIVFDNQLTINELAQKINTIPYEILTNVSERVKRVFYTI